MTPVWAPFNNINVFPIRTQCIVECIACIIDGESVEKGWQAKRKKREKI